MSVVTIIGSGQMGSALAFPARENGHEVRLVGSPLDTDIIKACRATNRHPVFKTDFPSGILFFTVDEMGAAIEGADMIIGGVSSFGVQWFGDYVLPRIPESTPVLSVTKGLFDLPDGRLLPYPMVWEEMLAKKGLCRNINAIGGPCTSYELVAHDHSEVAFCGPDLSTLATLKGIMETSYYHISITTDVMGIESAVALKNGYALAIALTIGENQRRSGLDSAPRFNSQAAIFYQSVKEMALLLEYQGAMELNNLAIGLGDLYVTVYGGRTRKIGILLGRGMDIDEAKQSLEGVTLESLVVAERVARAVRRAASLGRIDITNFPLLLHVDEIISNKAPVDIPWKQFSFIR
jgi:glycerol-3-phosphate dehydrogenase (NAD(P)+)